MTFNANYTIIEFVHFQSYNYSIHRLAKRAYETFQPIGEYEPVDDNGHLKGFAIGTFKGISEGYVTSGQPVIERYVKSLPKSRLLVELYDDIKAYGLAEPEAKFDLRDHLPSDHVEKRRTAAFQLSDYIRHSYTGPRIAETCRILSKIDAGQIVTGQSSLIPLFASARDNKAEVQLARDTGICYQSIVTVTAAIARYGLSAVNQCLIPPVARDRQESLSVSF